MPHDTITLNYKVYCDLFLKSNSGKLSLFWFFMPYYTMTFNIIHFFMEYYTMIFNFDIVYFDFSRNTLLYLFLTI